MRRVLFLAAAALPALALAAPAPRPAHPDPRPAVQAKAFKDCHAPGAMMAFGRKPANRSNKLGDQPPADLYLAVVRTVDGCPIPAMVRSGGGDR